jgi:hypothetical protein
MSPYLYILTLPERVPGPFVSIGLNIVILQHRPPQRGPLEASPTHQPAPLSHLVLIGLFTHRAGSCSADASGTRTRLALQGSLLVHINDILERARIQNLRHLHWKRNAHRSIKPNQFGDLSSHLHA